MPSENHIELESLSALGITSADQLVLTESLVDLERAIRAVPELMDRFQDDVFASCFNAYLQNSTLRKIGQPIFIESNFGEIGAMVAGLRGLGEPWEYYHNGGGWWLKPRVSASDLDEFLRSAGWCLLDDAESNLFYTAWISHGSRWI